MIQIDEISLGGENDKILRSCFAKYCIQCNQIHFGGGSEQIYELGMNLKTGMLFVVSYDSRDCGDYVYKDRGERGKDFFVISRIKFMTPYGYSVLDDEDGVYWDECEFIYYKTAVYSLVCGYLNGLPCSCKVKQNNICHQ